MIVKAIMDPGTCYGVKKCTEIGFRNDQKGRIGCLGRKNGCI